MRSKGFCVLIATLVMATLFVKPAFAKDHITETAPLAETVIVLYRNETKIQKWAESHHTNTQDTVFHTAKNFGEIKYTLPGFAVLYSYGRYNNNARLTDTAVLGIDSILLANSVTAIIKLTTNRHRPNTGAPNDTWDGLRGSTLEASSFPSGHSATAFATATVIANQYGNSKGAVNIAYGLAALTAFSRVYDNEHWASDVIVGSAIGYYSAKFIIKNHHGRSASDSAPTALPLLVPLIVKSL